MAGKRIIKAGYGRLGTGPSTEGPDAHQPVWWDRGYLPHVESPRMIQHVTFRLADSLPRAVVEQMVAALKEIPPMERKPEWVRRVQGYLDAGYGSCILRDPAAGELVQNALLHFHGERYYLHAWCEMPNHVHVLFQVHEGWTMSRCVWSWKSFTGRLSTSYGRVLSSHQVRRAEPWRTQWAASTPCGTANTSIATSATKRTT
jgi:hypothetical protein